MEDNKAKLVINGNAYYEIDLECVRKMETEQQKKENSQEKKKGKQQK